MTALTTMDLFPLQWNYPEPLADARSIILKSEALLVRLIDCNGVEGWGEIACFGGVAEVAAIIARKIIWPQIEGKDLGPREMARNLLAATAHYGQRGIVVSCISGLETALWDLIGQRAVLPISRLLGGRSHPLPIYASTGFYHGAPTSNHDRLAHLENQLASLDMERFAGVKIKIGRHGINDDTLRVHLARQIIGPEKWLIADANNAYTPRLALRLAEHVQQYNVLFIEEPIPFGRSSDSRTLSRASPVAIGGYELECGFAGFEPYIAEKALDYIQPDCCWSGGVAECMEIALFAHRKGIEVIPHNFSSPIATAANAQVLWGTGTAFALEFNATGTPLAEKILSNGKLSLSNGCLEPLEGPGLGLAPSVELLAEYLLPVN